MKLLLIGELNDTLYSLNMYLKEYFEIQLCSENSDNIRDMIRLFKPSILVMNMSEINDEVNGIFNMLSEKLSSMPMVVVGTSQIKDELVKQQDVFKKMSVLVRPLVASEVHKECCKILNINFQNTNLNYSSNYGKGPKKKILVVDDTALMLRTVKQILDSEYEVLLANSGDKAFKVLKENEVDLIFLDYEMPNMNGLQVFEKLISDDKTKDIPVIFLTSVDEKKRIFEVLKNKPKGYLLKPPAKEKILGAVREAFN